MRIDFYYWNYQCPLNNDMIELLDSYKNDFTLYYHDISKDQELAKQMQMYFPTLTIVNQIHRYFDPLTKRFLEDLKAGILPKEVPYIPKQGCLKQYGDRKVITKDILPLACLCSGGCSECAQYRKQEFYSVIGREVYGILMYNQEHNLYAGAEYVPSVLVPYDIPKSETTAFITCVYPTSEVYDFKSAPLHALEQYLSDTYEDVYVISDEKGTFPNGDLAFFLSNQYEDKGILSQEEGYCTLHLLHKRIK